MVLLHSGKKCFEPASWVGEGRRWVLSQQTLIVRLILRHKFATESGKFVPLSVAGLTRLAPSGVALIWPLNMHTM